MRYPGRVNIVITPVSTWKSGCQHNARVQAEIDDITRQMIDVEQQLLAAQNVKEDVGSLMEELARLQSKGRRKSEFGVPDDEKGPPYGDPFAQIVLRFYLFRQLFLAWLRWMRAALVLLLLLMFAAALAHFLHQKNRASADNHAGKQIQFSG